MVLMHLCYREKAELSRAIPVRQWKESEYAGTKFMQADDKVSQPIY